MSSSSPNFDRMSWYQAQAASFAPLSMYGDWFTNGSDHTAVFMQITNTTSDGQQWQFYAVSTSSYLIRCRTTGSDFYLGTGDGRSATDPPVPMMREDDSLGRDASVLWNVTAWGDGTFYLTNQANGTGFHLATSDNGQMLLDADTTKKDSQRWSFKSLSGNENPSYNQAQLPGLGIGEPSPSGVAAAASATGTSTGNGTLTSVAAETSSTSAALGSGITSGAAAGVAVVVTLAVVGLAAAGFLFFLKRRRKQAEKEEREQQKGNVGASVPSKQRGNWKPAFGRPELTHELYTKHPQIGELPAHEASKGQELPA